MLRKEIITPNLSGTETKLIKRRLVARIARVSSKNAYKTLEIPVGGLKVVGAFIRQRAYPDQPIVVYLRYYGKGAAGLNSEAFILSLNSEPMPSKYGRVTVDAGVGEKIYIAQPVDAGEPALKYNGYEGGFLNPTIVAVTDPVTGAQKDYYLYESVNDNLGETTIDLS